MTDFTDNFKAVKLKIMFKIIQHKNSNKVSVLFLCLFKKAIWFVIKEMFSFSSREENKVPIF